MTRPAYVLDAKRLSLAGAQAMMRAAMSKAGEIGVAVSVAIVDAGGHLVAFERGDDGRFHSVYSATTKAVTAASNRRPTTSRGAQGQELDVAHALGLALAAGPDRWTAMEGGFPILVGRDSIGGIGISGGNWEQDQVIAQAAVDALELSQASFE